MVQLLTSLKRRQRHPSPAPKIDGKPKRWKGPRTRLDYVFPNPGQAVLRTLHPEESRAIDTSGEVWQHAHYGKIDWRTVRVPRPLKEAFKHYIFHLLESAAPRSACASFDRLRRIQRAIDPHAAFPLLPLRVFKILASLDNAQLFHQFRVFYRWATKRQLPGFTAEVAQAIYRLDPPRRQVTIDPRSAERFLSDAEERALLKAVEETPAVDHPLLRNHVLTQLCWELGLRAAQARGIEERHVHVSDIAARRYFALDVPRVKQRSVMLEYRRRPISSELGEKLLLLLAQNRALFGPADSQAPIFRTHSRINIKTKHFGRRLNADTASRAVADFMRDSVGLPGYRSTNVLRHNMGQRLADLGTPAALIAEALDHSDLSSVQAYVRAKPDIATIKTRALGKSYAYAEILGWLEGRVPVPRTQAPANAIVQGMVAERFIGNIGVCDLPRDKLCPYNPVYACYGCSAFTPFINGEHAVVAEAMAAENLRLIEEAGAEGNRVALANEYPIKVARAVQALCDRSKAAS